MKLRVKRRDEISHRCYNTVLIAVKVIILIQIKKYYYFLLNANDNF